MSSPYDLSIRTAYRDPGARAQGLGQMLTDTEVSSQDKPEDRNDLDTAPSAMWNAGASCFPFTCTSTNQNRAFTVVDPLYGTGFHCPRDCSQGPM